MSEMKKLNPCNRAELTGILKGEFEFVYEEKERKVYAGLLSVLRKDGKEDEIPLLIREELLTTLGNISLDGKWLEIKGFVYGCTRNGKMWSGVFIQELSVVEETLYRNFIVICGEVSTKFVLRDAFEGRLASLDFLLKVATEEAKTQYIPVLSLSDLAYGITRNYKKHSMMKIKGGFISKKVKVRVPGSDEYTEKHVWKVRIRKVIAPKALY